MPTMGIRPGATQRLSGNFGGLRRMGKLNYAGVNGSSSAVNRMKVRIVNNPRRGRR